MIESNLNVKTETVKVPAPYKIELEKMHRRQMEEKSSFLVKGNLESPLLPALLNGTKESHGVEFQLAHPLDLNNRDSDIAFPFKISQATITKRSTSSTVKFNTPQEYYGTGSVRVRLAKKQSALRQKGDSLLRKILSYKPH